MTTFIGNIKNAELYIGQNAGKRIEKQLNNAKESIKIISPYIAQDTVELLNVKCANGINVQLLTSDDQRHFNNPDNSKVLKNIIIQNRIVDESKERLNDKLTQAIGIILFLTLAFLASNSYFTYLPTFNGFPGVLKILIPVILIVSLIIKSKITIRIYNYSYSTTFPITFVVDPMNMNQEEKDYYDKNAFYHVKLFIVDNKIAFLGSVNLTKKGMKYNVESCITLTNQDDIEGLIEYFDSVYNQKYYEMNIDYFGSRLYAEPIN